MPELPWRLVPFTEAHGPAVCAWTYPAPYEAYGWPEWSAMQRETREFADPDLRRDQYAAAVDADGALVGYAQFFPLAGVIRLGLGLRPDLCGRGWGAAYAQLLAQEAERRAPGCEVDLEVLVNNVRAVKAYERAGFVITDTYERPAPDGTAPLVHCMVYRPERGTAE
ncbi:GNAT family N-acetyltransferase [Paenibacillus athensensis]|nr:GNAT family N-acetyltransferase [Paenibacillus athensensis]